VELDSLWYRVLTVRYSVEDGRLCEGGRDVSVWWRDICTLRVDGWFHSHVSRSIGDGKNTLFWTDVWVGGVSLRDKFNRLYDLSMLKGELVFAMCTLGWGNEGASWSWRRRLFAWEEELVGELRLLLQNVTLQVTREDRWLWSLGTSSIYIVRSAYNFLNDQFPIENAVPVSSLWHKDVPLKVVLFAWHLFCDRLSTKDNLFRRRVLDIEAQICVGGCGLVETSSHLFLHCNLFCSVWNYIFQWLGVSAVVPVAVVDHFIQFSYIAGAAKSRRLILQGIWFATTWKIWKERNNKIFNAHKSSIMQVVDKIKSVIFRWLKVKFASLPFNYHG